MKMSIITVTYNSAATIAGTLHSVAIQSHSSIEHIIIDGASTDSTLEVIRQAGSSVSRVISEPDRGIYDAMNKGLELASGDFVGFLNADDVLADAHAIARIAECASRDRQVVYGDLLYVGNDLERIVRRWHAGEFHRSRLRFGWMPPHPTFYIKRTLIPVVGGFNTNFRIAADYDFMLRCLCSPGIRVGYVPSVIVRMRTGGASNKNIAAMLRKSHEDLSVIRLNNVGGITTLLLKNARKISQFF